MRTLGLVRKSRSEGYLPELHGQIVLEMVEVQTAVGLLGRKDGEKQ